MKRPDFDWERSIGGNYTEKDAIDECARTGQTFEQWGQDVADHYPEMFGEDAPEGLAGDIADYLEWFRDFGAPGKW